MTFCVVFAIIFYPLFDYRGRLFETFRLNFIGALSLIVDYKSLYFKGLKCEFCMLA